MRHKTHFADAPAVHGVRCRESCIADDPTQDNSDAEDEHVPLIRHGSSLHRSEGTQASLRSSRRSYISCAAVDELWGNEPPYPPCDEDQARWLQPLIYSWAGSFVKKCTSGTLCAADMLAPPMGCRTFSTGQRLSRRVHADLARRRSWEAYVGCPVHYKNEAAARGRLRWVGYMQQSRFPHDLVAGIEWSRPPRHRTRERLHHGTVHGECLFTVGGTLRDEPCCSCEPVDHIILDAEYAPEGKVPATPVAPSFLCSLLYAHWRIVAVQIPLRFLDDLCTLATPVLLERYIAYLNASTTSWQWGLLLVLGLLLANVAETVAAGKAFHLGIRATATLECATRALLFEKCLTVSRTALLLPTMSVGHVVNMCSNDVRILASLNWYIVYAISAPLPLVGSIVLLYRLVGWCAFAAVSAVLATLLIQSWLAKRMQEVRLRMMNVVDLRLKQINELLSGMQIVKFMGLERQFMTRIEKSRQHELRHLRRLQYVTAAFSAVNAATPIIVVFLVFVFYHATGNELTPEIVFPTIVLLNTMRTPFFTISVVLGAFMQATISSRRLTTFFEYEDARSDVDDINSQSLSGVAIRFAQADVQTYEPTVLPRCRARKVSVCEQLLSLLRPRQVPEEECCDVQSDTENSHAPTVLTHAAHTARNESVAGTSVNDAGPCETVPDAESLVKANTQGKPPLYQLQSKTLLHDINVQIPEGKLTLVVGATGSGKSTLLQSILGEYEVSRGHVWATKNVAYVPQQPWIMNATLRDNVLFFEQEDSVALQEAIRVSQLEMDLKQLTSGLETEIGEKGVNLSGGQKARVNLARAVYANRAVYLLDDPLSALDAHVGERVVSDCILQKLAGKTRVLATHHLHVLAKADFIIAVANGRLQFAGDRDEFLQTDVYRNLASSEIVVDEEENEGDNISDNRGDNATDKGSLMLNSGKGTATNAGEQSGGTQLIVQEEKATGSVPMSTYWLYFQYCGGKIVAAVVLGIYVVTEILSVSSTVWLSIWAGMSYNLSQRTYTLWYLILVLLGTVSAPLRFTSTFTAMRRGGVNLHKALLASVATGTMKFFDTTPLGRILNRFSRDIDVVDDTIQFSMTALMNCFMGICSSVAVAIVAQPLVLVSLVPCAYIYYRLMIFYNSANREIRRISSVVKSPMFSLLGELMSGISTVNAYGCSHAVMKEAFRRLDVVFACSHLENVANRWLGVRIEMLSNVIVTTISLLGVVSIGMHLSWIRPTLISLSLTMALQCTSQLNWLVRQAASVEADMNSVERLLYYINNIEKEEMPELQREIDALVQSNKLCNTRTSANTADNVTVEPTEIGFTDATKVKQCFTGQTVQAGSLEFMHVALRYRDGLPLVLRDVSFVIEPRAKVGIVGRTGSGKSTLLLAFMRMVDISEGEIIVNGAPIRSYPLRQLRRLFSMIPQDPVLFDGTVRLNVDPFLQATSEEVWHALEVVGLRQRIEMETEGIDSHVQEGGNNFSVGQRQLLCMARALLKRGSGFILMDEATANVDQQLDQHIQSTVMTAFSQYTVITIAHRLQTIARYDRVIVMDGGAVAEIGTPRDLMSRPTSLFRMMVESLGKAELRHFITSMESGGGV